MNTAEKSEALPTLSDIGLQNFAPYLMNRIMGRYNAGLRDDLLAMGLTTPKMRTLAVLSVNDGLMIRELAIYAVVEQSTLSRTLDKLEEDRCIRREVDRHDTRATRIFMTPKGLKVFEKIWPTMNEGYMNMFNDIPPDECHRFVGTLQKILGNIRHHDV